MCIVDLKKDFEQLTSHVSSATLIKPPKIFRQNDISKCPPASTTTKTTTTSTTAARKHQKNIDIKWILSLPQPAHLVAVVGLIYLGFTFFPKESRDGDLDVDGPNAVSTLVYMGTFAAHFGAQMWMTFISGIVLFFAIPRNVFAQVQRVLFPLYFFLNSILSLATIVTFIQHHQNYALSRQLQTQVWLLSLCFLIELCTRLYVVPPLLDALETRMELEKKADVGHEIGHHDPGKLKNSQEYIRLHKRFRKFHGLCAAANLTAVACNVIHLYFIATTIKVV
ncbi:hypothetical protein CHUAL_001094 [Chamberlinius hualienensis]